MTRKSIWLMILTAFAVSVVIVAGTMAANITHPSPAAHEKAETSVTQTEVSFVLRAWNGHLGLFRGSSDTPYSVLDMPLYLLADHDRELLEKGITAESEEELRRLIEDITS